MDLPEEIDPDTLSFHDERYWNHFYADEPAFYDWYTSSCWLPVAAEAVAQRVRTVCGREALDGLDVGCGVSPLLFSLAEAHPSGWSSLHGVDFSAQAVAFCASEAVKAGRHAGLRFTVGDARKLDAPDASADLVLDKGCLDVFVSGEGQADVRGYLAQLSRVVRRPHGRVLLLAVNGADVPHLLATGEVLADASCSQPRSGTARQSAWAESKRDCAAEPWTQLLFVEETVCYAEKHLLVLSPQQLEKPHMLRCHACGRASARLVAPDMPEKCACGNRLRRFALS
jgi:ubiquinone/menaquinone biosynthesis C-methylase UbiE